MSNRSPRWIAIALGALAFLPATAFAQTPATPQTAPPGTTQPEPERPDPTKVVPIAEPEPLDLMQRPGDEIKLSDEKLVTRWAHAQDTAKIHLSPQTSSRMITRLRFFTEDRLPEVYPVLGARMDSDGRRWLNIRIPKRPNGKTGWVLDEMLGQLYIVKTLLVVNRGKLKRDAVQEWQEDLERPRRHREVGHTDAPRTVLDPRAPEGHRRQQRLRTVGVRHERVLEPVGLARRRRRRDPRHQSARPHPGPPVARVHPREERQDPQARDAHADRHAREHHQLTAGPGRATLPAHIRG